MEVKAVFPDGFAIEGNPFGEEGRIGTKVKIRDGIINQQQAQEE